MRLDIYYAKFMQGQPAGLQLKGWVIKVVEEELNKLSGG